jgi:hypothetical protein
MKTAQAQNQEFEEFQKHLKDTAEEVRNWPDWKRLGGKATMGFSSARRDSSSGEIGRSEPNRNKRSKSQG